MHQNFEVSQNLVLDPDADEEEIGEDDAPDNWGSDDSPLEFDTMSKAVARATLILAMNRIIQFKNGKKLREYQLRTKLWQEAVLDEANEGKNIPFPKAPLMLTPFNARQINQAVFRARQYGNFTKLLEKAGFRATR